MSTTALSAPELTPLEEKFLKEIDARLEELHGPKQEWERLNDTRRRLVGTSSSNGQSSTIGTTTRTRRVRKGNRLEEFVALVTSRPGITIPEAASEMDVAANYLYRVRNTAKGKGLVRQEGQQLYPVDPSEPSPERIAELEAAAKK